MHSIRLLLCSTEHHLGYHLTVCCSRLKVMTCTPDCVEASWRWRHAYTVLPPSDSAQWEKAAQRTLLHCCSALQHKDTHIHSSLDGIRRLLT